MEISKKIGKGIKYSKKIRRSKFIPSLNNSIELFNALVNPSTTLGAGNKISSGIVSLIEGYSTFSFLFYQKSGINLEEIKIVENEK